MNITSGQWKGGQSIQSESGLFICRVLSSFDGWTHASDKQKFYSSKAPQNSEAEANARAIAEVPAMIEIIKRHRKILDLYPDRVRSVEDIDTILKRIEG